MFCLKECPSSSPVLGDPVSGLYLRLGKNLVSPVDLSSHLKRDPQAEVRILGSGLMLASRDEFLVLQKQSFAFQLCNLTSNALLPVQLALYLILYSEGEFTNILVLHKCQHENHTYLLNGAKRGIKRSHWLQRQEIKFKQWGVILILQLQQLEFQYLIYFGFRAACGLKFLFTFKCFKVFLKKSKGL